MWEPEIDNIVSKREKLQGLNINQTKLKYVIVKKRWKKITTNFETVNDENVVNKTFLDEKLLEIDGDISYIEKDYKEFILQFNKYSVEEILIPRAVKTTIQILYEKRLADSLPNDDDVLKEFLFVTSCRGDLDESKWCCSMILFINMY